MKKILFISNGYGEDTIASYIINTLRKKTTHLDISAFPLVGTGNNYKSFNIKLTGPVKSLPSGGDLHSLQRLLRDIKSGLFTLAFEQLFFLIKERKNFDLTVAVGDLLPVIMAGIGGLKPIVFIGTAKSNWYYPYSFPERFFLRHFCKMVFPRDLPTSEDLRKHSVNSIYAGNTMMDCFTITGEDFGIGRENKIIGILPGARETAYKDMPVILSSIEKITEKSELSFSFLAALPGSLDLDRINSKGWILEKNEVPEKGIVGYLRKDKIEVILTAEKFGDVINNSHIVIGQAGTGNEQAVGLGKPVVAFNPHPEKLDWYRARQKGLLGDAVSVVKDNPDVIAFEVLNILNDEKRMEIMGNTGKERLGKPGAIGKIAENIFKEFTF